MIQRQIIVVDTQGNILQSTYPKRARQLVKNQRADWADDDVIRLRSQPGKDIIMENTTPITPFEATADASAHTQNPEERLPASQADAAPSPAQEPDDAPDEIIMELAKERLAAKRKLIRQGWDLLLLALVLVCLINLDWPGERALLAFCYGLFWAVRYLIRLIRFSKPSFKGGFSSYVKQRRENKLNAEYIRLKHMLKEQPNP